MAVAYTLCRHGSLAPQRPWLLRELYKAAALLATNVSRVLCCHLTAQEYQLLKEPIDAALQSVELSLVCTVHYHSQTIFLF